MLNQKKGPFLPKASASESRPIFNRTWLAGTALFLLGVFFVAVMLSGSSNEVSNHVIPPKILTTSQSCRRIQPHESELEFVHCWNVSMNTEEKQITTMDLAFKGYSWRDPEIMKFSDNFIVNPAYVEYDCSMVSGVTLFIEFPHGVDYLHENFCQGKDDLICFQTLYKVFELFSTIKVSDEAINRVVFWQIYEGELEGAALAKFKELLQIVLSGFGGRRMIMIFRDSLHNIKCFDTVVSIDQSEELNYFSTPGSLEKFHSFLDSTLGVPEVRRDKCLLIADKLSDIYSPVMENYIHNMGAIDCAIITGIESRPLIDTFNTFRQAKKVVAVNGIVNRYLPVFNPQTTIVDLYTDAHERDERVVKAAERLHLEYSNEN